MAFDKNENAAKYREDHRAELAKKQREYYKANKEMRDEASKNYVNSHRDLSNAIKLKWIKNNPEKVEGMRRRKMEAKKAAKIDIILKSNGCSKCGLKFDGTNDCVFDLHHINPEEKEYRPSDIKSVEHFKKEAEKCIVLCANCHRLIHRPAED